MMMKLQFLLLTALIPAVTWATEPADTLLTKSNKKVIVNDSDGNVKVKVFKNDSTEVKPIFEGHYSEEQEVEQFFSSPFIPSRKRQSNKTFNSHLPFFFMEFNELSGNCFGSLNNDGLHTRTSKSWEWGLSVMQINIGLGARHTGNTGLVIGAQIINVHNHFAGDRVLTTDINDKTMLRDEPRGVKKSYISYWAVNIPAMVEFQRKYGHHKLYAGIGAAMEIRFSEHSRYFIGNDKYTETNNINLNPIGLNLQGYAGFGGIQIYLRSALTPLLNTSNAPKCYPIAIGLGLDI